MTLEIKIDVAEQVPPDIDAVGVPLAVGDPVPPPLDEKWCAGRGFAAKVGQSLAVPGDGSSVVLLGMGPRAELGQEAFRRAASALVRQCSRDSHVAMDIRQLEPCHLTGEDLGQAVAEGAALGTYRFARYKSTDESGRGPARLTVVADGFERVSAGVMRGALVAEAVALARDVVNEPAGVMTPRQLAEVAGELAEARGLALTVWDEVAISKEGLGGLAGVARGSEEPARLLKLVYEPSRETSRVKTVALVGKGITFDSGGLSLKSAEGMILQKTDMSGAAAVMATMSVLGRLGVPVRVIGIMPTTENMPGPGALKPGDVLRARNGKTIEVLNTDAEGRLVLADGLSLAAEEEPDAIIDLATLTGACVVALGKRVAGLMGNDEELVAHLKAAGDRAGEATWRLPLPETYRSDIDSDVADMKNIGLPGQAGALVAGLLLAEFVGAIPWAHVDMCGPARSDSDEGYLQKGATGFGVRTLVELLSHFGSDLNVHSPNPST